MPSNSWVQADPPSIPDAPGTAAELVDDLSGVVDAATARANLGLAGPVHPGGVPYHADLAGWQAKFEAATAEAPVDVVLITDSLWETGTLGPSAAQMLHRQLNAAAGVYLADPIGNSTLPLPVHAQGSGPTATSTQGTTSTTATGGQGSTLTNGQVLTHVASATGFVVLYRTDPTYGSLVIRDGAGGTVLASINCAAAAKSGNLWTSAALSDASHTLHITSTGTTRVEMVMPTRETHVRVWPCGRAGAATDDYIDNPSQALDFIGKLDAAGTLGLVLVGTGTNDDSEYATDIPALLAAIAAVTTADRALWLPYMNGGLTQPELDTSRATARTAGVPLIDASVVADQIPTIDGTHPALQGRVVMASHVSAVLSGDPIGAAIRLGGALAAGRGSISTQVQEAGMMMGGGDTYMLRTAAAEVSVGTGLGLLLGAPDGVVGLAVAQVTEGSDPAAAAASKVKVYAKNDGGRSRLYTRDDVGVRSVAFVDDTPANHASRHGDGGADEIALDASQITTGIVAAARLGTGTANSTTALFGDGTYKVPSGGGGATWSPEPDPPGSPSAYDDEFDGTSSVTWTDTPTAATTKDIDSFSPGCLHLKGVGTGNNLIGVVQAPPGSFPYTITTRLVSRGAPVSYHRHGGILLCNGITSGSTIWYAGQVWEGAELHRAFSQTFGGSWIGGAGGWQGRDSARFVRITVTSASSATAYFSDDGYVWVAYDTFNPGFTPTHIGLGCSQESSGSVPIEVTFGFFRVT